MLSTRYITSSLFRNFSSSCHSSLKSSFQFDGVTMKLWWRVFVPLVFITMITTVIGQDFKKCETKAFPPDHSSLVPTYEVNLDLPPRQRWATLMKDKGHRLLKLIDDVEELIKSIVGEKIFNLLNDNLPKLAATLPEPFYEEMIGIATYSGLPLSKVTLYNIFYEAFTLCTSIVAQNSDGQLYHGRNLDFGVFFGWDSKNHTWRVAENLRPLTVRLEWKKNGTTLFESINFAGYVGILTGVKKNSFSFSLDKRFALNGGVMGLLEWILFEDYKQSWIGFLTREVMEEVENFEDAKFKLSRTRLLAPVYFILGGTKPGEGCIITRDRDNFNLVTLGSNRTEFESWYVIQTNYDPWKSPPFFDDRRTPANHCMAEGGQKGASQTLIYNVLSTKPVLNKETVYTALMKATTGEVQAWIRQCPDPCWPW